MSIGTKTLGKLMISCFERSIEVQITYCGHFSYTLGRGVHVGTARCAQERNELIEVFSPLYLLEFHLPKHNRISILLCTLENPT